MTNYSFGGWIKLDTFLFVGKDLGKALPFGLDRYSSMCLVPY